MNPKITKVIFVIQDLITKDKESVAVLSGDVHLYKEKKPISFQMLLDDNKEFARAIKDICAEALILNDQKKNK